MQKNIHIEVIILKNFKKVIIWWFADSHLVLTQFKMATTVYWPEKTQNDYNLNQCLVFLELSIIPNTYFMYNKILDLFSVNPGVNH